MHSDCHRRLAWRDLDVMLLALATVVAVGAWIGASVGVSYARTARGELAWANLGVVGLLVFGGANALWLLRGRRAIGTRRVALVRLAPAHADVTAPLVASGLVRVARGRWVHRASCPLVAGKAVEPSDASGATCRVCAP